MANQTQSDLMSNDKTIEIVTLSIAEKDGYAGEPTIPTLEQIQAFTAEAPDNEWVVFVLIRPNASRYDVHSISEDTKRLELARRIMLQRSFTSETPETSEEQIWAMTNILHKGTTVEHLRQDFYEVDPAHFETIANFMKRTAGEPTPERLQWLHKAWEKARDNHPEMNIPHPLAPIIREWLQEQTAKHINREYDRKHPVAVLRHPLGSVRELAFTDREMGQVFKTPESVDQIQMELDLGDTPSILPAIMPLHVVRTANLKPQTKSGAVSHELRIFFEAMMALQPKQRRADLMFRLGDLIDFLYPNGKFNWTNQMPHIKRALGVLHTYATVPWIDDQGSLREWRPVAVRVPLIDEATRDTPIYIEVQMPPDARRGHMVIKDIHRRTGMKSASQWNSYHVAGYLWDKYGTVKGGLIDTTRPVVRRDGQNRLVDASGKPLVNRNGRDINNPYHPEAVRQLDREPNPEAVKRYPILSSEDLILACFPNGYPTDNRRAYLKRAKTHWGQLEADGHIVIQKERHGWRILPSEEHLNAHRALRKSVKGVY